MSHYKNLKKAKSLHELAHVLGYKPKNLSYILYKIPVENQYSSFEIDKKSGGKREILAPNKKLKKLQRRLADVLYQCIEENKPETEKLAVFNGKKPIKRRATRAISHGYQKGLSIASNAEQHVNKRYVLNLDIKDFFPSINFGRVRGFFIKSNLFRLDTKVATIIAQIACFKNELPQGSPCSPVISNLIAQSLDFQILKLAKEYKCTYTRYVDDLTFSTNKKVFPKQIAYKKFASKKQWIIGKKLLEKIDYSGFQVNRLKTRMQLKTSRQEVTGLVTNKVVNIKLSYYKNARAMCNSMFNHGFYTVSGSLDRASINEGGKGIFKGLLSRIHRALGFKVKDKVINVKDNQTDEKEKLTNLDKLGGILNYIYLIKTYRNKFAHEGFRRFRHDGTIAPEHNGGSKQYPPLNRENEYAHESHRVSIDGIKNLYQKFLFFKHFYYLDKPLIVCEGKTDNVYLKCAIESLYSLFPELIEKSDDKLSLKINFFNKTDTNREMLKLAEGASGLKFLMLMYSRMFKNFRCEGKKFPVIFVVDKDKAGKEASHIAKKVSNESSLVLPHVTENLFFLEIPSTKKNVDVEMEDLFHPSVLQIQLEGKKFNRKNGNLDHGSEFGKDYFSRFVVRKNRSTIDFDGFKPLLEIISEIIKKYPK